VEPLLAGLQLERLDAQLEFAQFMCYWVGLGLVLHFVISQAPTDEDDL